MHSHMFETPNFQKFFQGLTKISPQLKWEEKDGNLICHQTTTPEKENKTKLDTVKKVMKELDLIFKPGEHSVKENSDGTMIYTFTLKGIYNQLNSRDVMKNLTKLMSTTDGNQKAKHTMTRS